MCVIVARHGGTARPLWGVVADVYPLFYEKLFSRSHWLGSTLQTCWCGTLATKLSWQWPFPFFPRGCHLLDGDDNYMLSVPLSKSDLHFSCWQSSANCQAMIAEAFMLLGYALWFYLKGCSFCLVHALSAPRFPSCEPDTASFRLLSVITTGIPWHAGSWHLRRKQCTVLFLFLLDWFCTWCHVPGGLKHQTLLNFEVLQLCKVVFFWVLPFSTCLHCSRPFILGTLSRSQKSTTFCCGESVSHHVGSRCDELPQGCFVVSCLIVQLCTFFSAICILWGTTLSHDRLGMPMEALLDPGRCLFKKAYVEEWVSSLMLLMNVPILNVPISKVRVMSSLRLLRLSHRHHGDHRKSRTQLPPLQPRSTWWTLGITLLLWCCFVRIRGSCPHQDRITLPGGVRWAFKRF